MSWALSDIRAKVRLLSGRGSTDDITNNNVDLEINRYYQEDFPVDIRADAALADYTKEIVVSDSGEYSLADTVLDLNSPWTANQYDLELYNDRERFFADYPVNDGEQFITQPTLAIGSGDSTKVKCAAFSFRIAEWTYDKASAETALSGDTVPQSKYGAWMLSVDADGAVTITEADANATGYATPGLAVNGIPSVGADQAIMGFVTAINTGGTFIPGTTDLATGGTVTATYTDGDPGLRNIPAAACVTDGKLFIRPKPMDKYLVRAKSSLSAPATLSGSATAVDETWGPLIACGAAIRILAERADTTRAAEVFGDVNIAGTYEYHRLRIIKKRIKQDSNRECQRSW